MYDNNGDVFGFTYNGTEYYYIKNAQNDVVAIADASGNVVVRYYYNAWGEIIDCVDNTTVELFVRNVFLRSEWCEQCFLSLLLEKADVLS